ncbi:ROK family protein [Egicoccus sp. AB-alg6-2]|uniref:ROK family protein n=1 Tax=Egicoccus sp. AB-alg6-2 TaxID=3242692 RepID=UPI00359CE4D5
MSLELPPPAEAVAVAVLVHGPVSRSQLAKQLGLSPPTITRLVRPLITAGVLVESDAVRTPGRGRASLPLDVVADAYRFVGVKLTTESIYAVTTDLRARVLDSETIAEPSLDVPDVVAAVVELVTRLQDRSGRPADAIGVTVGGVVDDGETVVDSPFLHWHEVPFRSLLAVKLDSPVFLANDVVGLTMAQQWFGHGREYSDFALLTVGAGVGYGLVINDQLVPTTVSPVSHLPIDPHGPLCPAGHRGCMTAYVTAGAMTAAAALAYREPVTYAQLLQRAEDADPVAVRVVDDAAHALGRAVAAVTALTGVERIILTGEGVRLAELGRRALRAARLEYGGRGEREDPVIRQMDFLEWARGAAVVALRTTFPDPPRICP